ncbi:MAG: type II toxin-antitoxin system VapC family toxin [Chloroflexi bacterium]|nr:type II toxin-antitoxin system VapC family toxin [Chloroflexota bacterium]
MKTVLLDSSVLAKWYVNELNSPLAISLQRHYIHHKIQLAYAELSLFEVANALRYSGLFTTIDIVTAIAALQALGMQRLNHDEQAFRRAVQLSADYAIAIYDSYLIALAEQQAIDFVTADGKLLRKVFALSFVYDLAYYQID